MNELFKEVRRGEIHYMDEVKGQIDSEMKKSRPVVIVSNDIQCKTSGVIQVVYLTTNTSKHLPTHVLINDKTAKPAVGSVALCENVYSISKRRLQQESYVGRISDEEMELIDRALLLSLGLDDYVFERTSMYKEENDTNPVVKLKNKALPENENRLVVEMRFNEEQYNTLFRKINEEN